MTFGNNRLEMLDNQHKLAASASNQTITAQQHADDVAEVEKEMPGWTPKLGHVYDNAPTYDYILPAAANGNGQQSANGASANPQTQNQPDSGVVHVNNHISSQVSGSNAGTSQSSASYNSSNQSAGNNTNYSIDTSYSPGVQISPSDIAATAPSFSVSLPPLAPMQVVQLDPDALQVTLGGHQAPPNLMTVAFNTLPNQAGRGTSPAAVTNSGMSALGSTVQSALGAIQSANQVVTNLQNKAADAMVNLGAWGDRQNNLVGEAAKVLGGIGYVVTAPVDWKAANAEFAGWKGAMQSGLASVGGWGDRQGGILGGAVYYGAGALSVADEILQPGSVTDAALVAAGPVIGKGVGVAVKILSKIPGASTNVGAVFTGAGPLIRRLLKAGEASADEAYQTAGDSIGGGGKVGAPNVPGNGKALITEDAVNQELSALENSNQGAHFLDRHGEGTTLEQQQIRASTGLTPDNIQQRPNDASRWLSNADIWEGQQRAQLIFDRTGQESVQVEFDRIIGEGYLKGGDTYATSNVGQFVFKNGKLYTAYPVLQLK